ncbi:MAG: hypothetical protein F6K18_07600 [Okeania sp. SIO2C2]|nr:hypothetical protein [Okeania sp. SIO2C2]
MNKKSCVGASYTQFFNHITIFLAMQEENLCRFFGASQDDIFGFVHIAIAEQVR